MYLLTQTHFYLIPLTFNTCLWHDLLMLRFSNCNNVHRLQMACPFLADALGSRPIAFEGCRE